MTQIEHNEKRTVLMHACRAGHTAIAQALLAVSHVEVDLMDLYVRLRNACFPPFYCNYS